MICKLLCKLFCLLLPFLCMGGKMPAVTNSQIRNLELPAGNYSWILPAGAEKVTLGRVSSSIGTLSAENLLFKGVRVGARNITFEPSRLRTFFRIQDLTITTPILSLESNSFESATSQVEGNFGFVVQIVVGGVGYYVQNPPSSTFVLKEGAKRAEKKPETQQLQLQEVIAVPPGASI